MNKKTAIKIYDILLGANSQPKSELVFSNPLECIVAVLLSAQCKDSRVNVVTEKLFKKFKTAKDYATCNLQELEEIIHSINFFPTKAKNIIELCKILDEKFAGQVPSDLETLITLPGVGRKTAQVVLVEAFNKPAVPVDTHVFRVCNRLGICDAKNVLETESAIRDLFEEDKLINLHKLLVLHGRYVCKSKNPDCSGCILKDFCEKRI